MNTLIIIGATVLWLLSAIACYGYMWRYAMRATRYDDSEKPVMRVMIAVSSAVAGLFGPIGVFACVAMSKNAKHGWGFSWEPYRHEPKPVGTSQQGALQSFHYWQSVTTCVCASELPQGGCLRCDIDTLLELTGERIPQAGQAAPLQSVPTLSDNRL